MFVKTVKTKYIFRQMTFSLLSVRICQGVSGRNVTQNYNTHRLPRVSTITHLPAIPVITEVTKLSSKSQSSFCSTNPYFQT